MDVKLPAGKYIVAVSGGVDSVALLDLLAKQPHLDLIVAHFDHGIRLDSKKDAQFVASLAEDYDMKFEISAGELGPKASEEKARDARYKFLTGVAKKHNAKAVVTAHHQDDLIETALINLLRGTGVRGLVSIGESPTLRRPLLNYSKKQLLTYVKKNSLKWREDQSNKDKNYLRNYLRTEIIPKMTQAQRETFLYRLEKSTQTARELDEVIATLSHRLGDDSKINRQLFSALDNKSGQELLHARYRKLGEVNRLTIKRLNNAIRTARPGSRTEIINGRYLLVDKDWAWIG